MDPAPGPGHAPADPARAISDYLSAVTTRLDAQLGDRLLSVWLVGSGALGDLSPLHSDVDVQAVCATRLSRAELRRIAGALSHEALPCPVRGLEFVLYAREDLVDARGPAFQLNLNTGPRMEQHAGYDPDAEPRFWFVLDVAIAAERAHPLAGPPPRAILPALPPRLVLHALRDALGWYGAHDPAQAVLAACRAWAWAVDRRWLSKTEAAAWATARPGESAAIAEALAQRADPRAPGPPRAEAAALLERVDRVLVAAAGRTA